MGQNFLIDPDIPYHIAEASGADAHCGVLEIGPGIGPLTQQLAQRAGRVVAIELDTALLPILQETMAEYDNVTIRHGDILKQNLPELVAEVFDGLTPMVCANLPYNITTPVLTALLESQQFSAITVMIQREVAKRICAQPGTSDYGAFSLYCQYHAQCELLFEVPPDCFIPAPKVTSAVIQLTPTQQPPVAVSDEGFLFRVVRAAFSMRRFFINSDFALFFLAPSASVSFIVFIIKTCPSQCFTLIFPFNHPCLGQYAKPKYLRLLSENQFIRLVTFRPHL